jgi:hypothetical protein
LRVVAASSEAAELMALLQLQSDEGTSLDCFQSATPVSVGDLTGAASRWPGFVAAVAERGQFRAVHALPLRAQRRLGVRAAARVGAEPQSKARGRGRTDRPTRTRTRGDHNFPEAN